MPILDLPEQEGEVYPSLGNLDTLVTVDVESNRVKDPVPQYDDGSSSPVQQESSIQR